MKNDRFHNGDLDAPVEFEMSDYDEAKRNSPHAQEPDAILPKEPDALRPTTEETTPLQDPIIKQEPTTEDKNDLTPHTETGPSETPPAPRRRISRKVEKLKSNLDGPSWECKGTHGRRSFRVTKTGLETGPDYQGTWDNVIEIEDTKTPQEN